MKHMTTREAIEFLVREGMSMYRIAKTLRVAPISVSNYRYGDNKMGLVTAARFEELFNIVITDAARPGRKADENN